MDIGYNYWLIWFIYVSASVIFYGCLWWLTWSESIRLGNYSFRAITAAIIFTPWYANTQGSELAPALMVFVLDLITINSIALSRAVIPLILAIILAEVVAIVIFLSKRKRVKK